MNKNVFQKKMVFITGSPRSGTSLVTKVIDAHPECAILMENIFGNRRRHWARADFWDQELSFMEAVSCVYDRFDEPVIGNKVITPDVWSLEDIDQFLSLFRDKRIVFIVRNPLDVAMSRITREPTDFNKVFNETARENLTLDFRSRFHTYISSWEYGLKNYRMIKASRPEMTYLIYYEDFCSDFNQQVNLLFSFLGLPVTREVYDWHQLPHHNAEGELEVNLKYPDCVIELMQNKYCYPNELIEIIESVSGEFERWEERSL